MTLQGLALPAVIVTLVVLLLYSSSTSSPVFFVAPPVTRRLNPYYIAYPPQPRCSTLATQGNWTDFAVPVVGECPKSYTTCSLHSVRRWQWTPAAVECGAHPFNKDASQEALAGKWIAFVGDSISRNLCAALMRALGAEASAFIFQRHEDFQRSLVRDITVTFHWSPFPENTTKLMGTWRHQKKPAFVVTTTSLWHMLYYSDAAAYRTELERMLIATQDMLPKLPDVQKPLMVLATGTEVHPELLMTPAKRAAMTPKQVDAYNQALDDAAMLAPKGPFGMLDMFSMTYGCGLECSVDGVHSKPEVYDAAAQVLLNMLNLCRDGDQCWAAP